MSVLLLRVFVVCCGSVFRKAVLLLVDTPRISSGLYGDIYLDICTSENKCFAFFACVCCVCVRVPEEVYKHMYQDKTMIVLVAMVMVTSV